FLGVRLWKAVPLRSEPGGKHLPFVIPFRRLHEAESIPGVQAQSVRCERTTPGDDTAFRAILRISQQQTLWEATGCLPDVNAPVQPSSALSSDPTSRQLVSCPPICLRTQ